MTDPKFYLPPDNLPYWGEHPKFPVVYWQEEVCAGITRCGYWEWVNKQIEGDY